MAIGSTKTVEPKRVLGLTEHGSAVERGFQSVSKILQRSSNVARNARSQGSSEFVAGRPAGTMQANAGQQTKASASRFLNAPARHADVKSDSRRPPEEWHIMLADSLIAIAKSAGIEVAADVFQKIVAECKLERDSRGQYT